jgi:hypothetical protein
LGVKRRVELLDDYGSHITTVDAPAHTEGFEGADFSGLCAPGSGGLSRRAISNGPDRLTVKLLPQSDVRLLRLVVAYCPLIRLAEFDELKCGSAGGCLKGRYNRRAMSPLLLPFQFVLLSFSGWVNRHQLDVIE